MPVGRGGCRCRTAQNMRGKRYNKKVLGHAKKNGKGLWTSPIPSRACKQGSAGSRTGDPVGDMTGALLY